MSLLRTFFAAASLLAVVVGTPSSASVLPGASAAMVSPAALAGSSSRATGTQNSEAADAREASRLLGELKSRYRHLNGVTVSIGTTPRGEQAVAYYTEARIVISRAHTVSIEKILDHEIWHVIDWRDNGRMDWQENLPPSNAQDYERK
jgi:hypothetical protein